MPIIWERDALRGVLKGSTIDSKKDPTFSWISTRNWSNWRSLYPDGQGRAERFHLSNVRIRILSLQTKMVDLSQQFWKNRPIEKSFWLQRCVDHIEPSTPRIWRTTTQASSILEIPAIALIIEFFLQLVAMERFLVELIIIQRKSTNELMCKSDMIERGDPFVCRLWIKPQTCDFHNFSLILLQLDRLQLTSV